MRAENPHVTSDAWKYLSYQDIPTIASLFAVEPLERAAAVAVIAHFCEVIGGERIGQVETDYSRFSTFTRVWFPADDEEMTLVTDLLHVTLGQPEKAYESIRTRFAVMEMEAAANGL